MLHSEALQGVAKQAKGGGKNGAFPRGKLENASERAAFGLHR
jgi:hypothetical protein